MNSAEGARSERKDGGASPTLRLAPGRRLRQRAERHIQLPPRRSLRFAGWGLPHRLHHGSRQDEGRDNRPRGIHGSRYGEAKDS